MQHIYVSTNHNQCTLCFQTITAHGFCGKRGCTSTKQEGDCKTPFGVFPIHYGFYIRHKPHTPLPMIPLSSSHYFVDDVHSPCYNRLVFGKPHHSAEHMIEFDSQYQWGLVIEYNRNPVVAGRGSALFLHCGNQPTAGCIALPSHILLTVIQQIRPHDPLFIHIK